MWPWGHLAVGYLLYTAGVRLLRTDHDHLALVALLVGTQAPDLVDKPLALVGAVPYGRSLAHSLVVLAPACLLVLVVARRRGWGHAGAAFGLGALSHVVSDAWAGLVALDFERVTFLLWPLVALPASSVRETPTGHAARLAESVGTTRASTGGPLDVTLSEPVAQFLLLVVAVLLWVAEGRPGWRDGGG